MFLSETNMVNRLKQTAQEGSKLLHQYGEESNYPKLMLYYTNTRKFCGNDANLQVTVILCLSTLMWQCSLGHGSHWAQAGPGGILRASEANKNSSGWADNPLTICKEIQQGVKYWRKIWSRLALMHASSLSRLVVRELGMLQTLNISATRCGSGR